MEVKGRFVAIFGKELAQFKHCLNSSRRHSSKVCADSCCLSATASKAHHNGQKSNGVSWATVSLVAIINASIQGILF
jgi:hypothetical protein